MTKLIRYGQIFVHWKLRRAVTLPYLPEDISVEITNLCNFRCHYCPQSDPEHLKRVRPTTLTPEGADRLLGRIRGGGVKTNVLHWTLDGEPFVNQRFDEICAIAHRHGFTNMIFSTNGSLATVDRLRAFPTPAGARYTLCIDFCDQREFFETWRGKTGSWDDARANVEAISTDAALPHVRIKLTDITSYKVRDPAELGRRTAALRALFPSPRVEVTTRVFHNATGFVKGLRTQATRGYNVCPYPWTSLVVASNGDVVACCRDLDHKTVVGNLFREELLDIWNGPAYRQLRQSLLDQRPEGACADCDMPYQAAKFTMAHVARTALRRLQVFG